MPYLNLDTCKINYNIQGKGRLLILLHNGFYSSASWDNVRNKLAQNFKVIDYDRYGYGKSTHIKDDISGDIIENGVYELDQVIRNLGLEKVNLCGHCLGGAIALLYAKQNPGKVEKIITESTGYFSDFKIRVKCDFTFQDFDSLPESLRNRLVQMHGNDYIKSMWKILCDYKHGYIMDEEYNMLDKIKSIKTPVLIACGDNDFYFDVEHPLKAYKRIKNSQLWISPGTGHDLHIEKPDEFVNNLLKFL